MTGATDMSPYGRAVLEAREGKRLKAYRDSVGIWTIGYGHTAAAGAPIPRSGLTISDTLADQVFAKDLVHYVNTVSRSLQRHDVPQPFFDACVSLCFNIGEGGFAHSTVARLGALGEWSQAAAAFLMWDHPAELLHRRLAERDQAKLPVYGRAFARAGDKLPVPQPKGPQT